MIPNRKKISRNASSSGLRSLLWGIAILIVCLLCFGIYSLIRSTARRITADYYFPFLKAARAAENTVAEQGLLMQSKTTLARALRNLMTENAVLTAERAVVSDLKKENAELRALLQLNPKGVFRPVFAEVLTRNPMTWQQEFVIDKGSRDGIEPGNLVVTVVSSGSGNAPMAVVVGKVKSLDVIDAAGKTRSLDTAGHVTGHTSLVSTILSQDFKLSVSLPETKSSGILEGARHISDMRSTLKFLPLNAFPTPGQLVCTNSFSGNSPPGLPVGKIVSIGGASQDSPLRNRLYREASVQPFESPAEVRFVAVYVKDKK